MTSRSVFFNLLALLLTLLAAWPVTAQDNESTGRDTVRFTPDQLSADIDYLFETLERIHPDLYYSTPKDTIAALCNEIKSQLDHPLTAREFWLKMAPVVVRLRDGHTGLFYPRQDYQAYSDSTNIVFPLDVKVEGEGLFVGHNYTDDSLLSVNSRILDIDGIPADSLLKTMRRYHFGERESFINIKTENDFNIYLWLLFNLSDNFSIRFNSAIDGKSYLNNYPGIPYPDYLAEKQSTKGKRKLYAYYKIPGTRIGVIEFNAMVRNRQFKKFLDSAFAVILADSTKDLIIDIRKNGGGNSSLVNSLLRHFNTKPYTQATQIDLKVSKNARRQFRKMIFKWYMYPLYPVALFSRETRPLLFGKKGRVVNYYIEPKKYKPDKLFFDGDVYLLTSPNTFSSANILAAVFKCYDMGTMIGEETGGLTIAFGDLIYYKLPNTGLYGCCSFKRFYHPCGKNDNHGVIPDIIVKPDPEDEKNQIDTMLDFTVDYILNRD